MQHSSIPPSSLNRVVHCTASLKYSRESELPELANEECEIGTAAHALAESMLKGEAFESPLIDDEMIDHVKGYVEYCKSISGTHYIEQRVEIPQVHSECWGTFDFGAIDSSTAHIVDLKYGYRFVDVMSNYPLLAYAGGIVRLSPKRISLITMHIYQPRGHQPGGVARTVTITADQLNKQLAYIAQRVNEAVEGVPQFTTGKCYKCPRLHDCPAATAASYNAIDVIMRSNTSANSESLQLGRDLLAIENAERVLSDRKTALREVLMFRLSSGIPCPTHTIETKLGNRAWSVSDAEVEAIAQVEGITDTHNLKLKSPAQMEKAGVDKKIVKSIVKRSQYGKLKQIDFETAKRIFKND